MEPSYEDICSYCRKKNLNVDPRKFYDYYKRQHFQYKGLPMDWQAKLEDWDRTEYRRPNRIMEPDSPDDPFRVEKYGRRMTLEELKKAIEQI